jgi:hypothetical protein
MRTPYSNCQTKSKAHSRPGIRISHRFRPKQKRGEVFVKYKPLVVIPRGAHKHVRSGKQSAGRGDQQHRGTKNMIDMADEYAVENFVMISRQGGQIRPT